MKKSLKKFIVPVLTSKPVTKIADRFCNLGVPIFMIHRVTSEHTADPGTITSEHLRKCLTYLVKHGYVFISLEQLVIALRQKNSIPDKSVVFTMDDGFIDQAQIAAPIFIEFNCPVTIFVITGMQNNKIWPWDDKVAWIVQSSVLERLKKSVTLEKLNIKLDNNANKRKITENIQNAIKLVDAKSISEILLNISQDAGVSLPEYAPEKYRPMTWSLARKLEIQGIQFAPHSVNHYIMSRLDKISMENEINESWEALKKELKCPVKIFCYPTGRNIDYGEREIEVLKKNKYTGAVTTVPGVVKQSYDNDNQLYNLSRLNMPTNIVDFIQYCSWIERIR